ncbi:Hypothetical predicted protein [Olea europaea subsp. europaea]|uniref:Uncharacterized protein n=1 Tax=Olea europaea subsp. europaea TaxID=158383 RepID=A0A8S0U3J3_OLEEU|nr:Hypothetical predicted protein [Olea europaea subsp. europaea]
MQFGDTGDTGTSVLVQSHIPRPWLSIIIDGCKVHSSDVEDDNDDNLVDTPLRRKKISSHFHPPTEEHAKREYYPTEPKGHDIHTSAQSQATRADDEPQPAEQSIDQLIRVQGEIRLDMTKIRSSMTFLSDFVTTLISSKMDTILAKASEKSEAHSVGDALQQEKGKMDLADEIEYPFFPPTPSFDLGVASTPIISNEIDVIIAGMVKDCEIEEQADVATKTINEDQGSPPSSLTLGLPIKRAPRPTRTLQSPSITGAGKQIKLSDDAIVFDKHDKKADNADVVAFQNWFNRGYKLRNKYVHLKSCALIYKVG